MEHPMHVASEIGELQTVLLKTPWTGIGKLNAGLFTATII